VFRGFESHSLRNEVEERSNPPVRVACGIRVCEPCERTAGPGDGAAERPRVRASTLSEFYEEREMLIVLV
jgi:hypothetical protein